MLHFLKLNIKRYISFLSHINFWENVEGYKLKSYILETYVNERNIKDRLEFNNLCFLFWKIVES